MSSSTWQLSTVQPQQWPAWVRICDGGVFHTSAGLEVDAPGGTAVYGRLVSPTGAIEGVALGAQSRCRLSLKERHLHYPTLPALAPGVDPSVALNDFQETLSTLGFAEVVIGSYDARYVPPDGLAPRLEYVLSIPPSGDITAQLGTTHRRHVKRGDRDGWTVRILTGAEATAAILDVQQSTAERAATLNRGFAPAQHTTWANALISSLPLPESGLMVVGAYHGDTLLASVLLGWGATRAFYLIGGSTPEGYQCGAAVWLHSRVIRMLAEHNLTTYNLGGTPLDAANESSPAHGLYRFKAGFGVSPVERRGLRWELHPVHMKLHRILTRLLHR